MGMDAVILQQKARAFLMAMPIPPPASASRGTGDPEKKQNEELAEQMRRLQAMLNVAI